MKKHRIYSLISLGSLALLTISSLLLATGCSGSGSNKVNKSGELSEKDYSSRYIKPSLCSAPEIMEKVDEIMTEEALAQQNGEVAGDITMLPPRDTIGYCHVETTQNLRIFTPKYNKVTLHVGPSNPEQIPSRSLVFPSAYTKGGNAPMIEQIVGDFVTCDSLYKGVEDPFITGYFVFNGDTKEYDFISAGDAEERLKDAASHHGTAFGQDMVIRDGLIVKTVREQVGKDRVDRYRVLCDLGGKLRVVESQEKIKFQDFQQYLIDLGVKDAIYLDMGSYNYGWFQGNEGFETLPDVYDFKDNKYCNFLIFEM